MPRPPQERHGQMMVCKNPDCPRDGEPIYVPPSRVPNFKFCTLSCKAMVGDVYVHGKGTVPKPQPRECPNCGEFKVTGTDTYCGFPCAMDAKRKNSGKQAAYDSRWNFEADDATQAVHG